MIFSTLDLPAPLGPTTPIFAPGQERQRDVVEDDLVAVRLAHLAHRVDVLRHAAWNSRRLISRPVSQPAGRRSHGGSGERRLRLRHAGRRRAGVDRRLVRSGAGPAAASGGRPRCRGRGRARRRPPPAHRWTGSARPSRTSGWTAGRSPPPDRPCAARPPRCRRGRASRSRRGTAIPRPTHRAGRPGPERRAVEATRNPATSTPASVVRSCGSSTRLPTRVTLVSFIPSPPRPAAARAAALTGTLPPAQPRAEALIRDLWTADPPVDNRSRRPGRRCYHLAMTFTRRPTWDSGRVRVGILGPLEVEDDAGRPVEVGGARLRALLTRLALDAGRPVSVDALVDALWGDAPPADQANACSPWSPGCAGRCPAPARSNPVRAATGSTSRPDAVDAHRFERLAARRPASAAPPATRPAAADLLGQALALWRGPALADAAGRRCAIAAAARLDELRLAATEDRVEAELRARPARRRWWPSWSALAADHPLRERLRGLLRCTRCGGRAARPRRWPPTRTSAAGWPTSSAPTRRRSCRTSTSRSCAATRWPRRPPGAAPRQPARRAHQLRRPRRRARRGHQAARPRTGWSRWSGPGGAGKTRLAARRRPAARPASAGRRLAGRAGPGHRRRPTCRRRCSRARPRREPPRRADRRDVSRATPSAGSSTLLAGRRRAARARQLRAPDRRGRPASPTTCSPAARGCACSPPAGSRWASSARRCARCRRCACPRRTPRRGDALAYPAVQLLRDRAAAVRPGFAVDRRQRRRRRRDLPPARRAAAGHRAGRGPAAHAVRSSRSPPG